MQRLLNPTNDWMFKQLFGTEKRKDLTIHLINALLEGTQPRVVDVEFLKLVLDKDIGVLRQSIVDVLCKAEDGRHFIVEMQRAHDNFFIKRLVEYTCQVYINQRPKTAKHIGDRGGYDKIRPVVCLAVMESTLFPKKENFLSHHEFRDIVSNEPDIKEMSFTFLELPKFHKRFKDLTTDVDRWAYFFCHAVETPPHLWEHILTENNVFSQAYRALVEAAYTPEQLLTYLGFEQKNAEILIQNDEAREKGRAEGLTQGREEGLVEGLAKGKEAGLVEGLAKGKEAGLAEGLAKGKEAGLAEGRADERRLLARRLLERGLPLEEIAELTGLSSSELQALVIS